MESEKEDYVDSLFAGRLTKKRRKFIADLAPVEMEMRRQWDESADIDVDMEIKDQIWQRIEERRRRKSIYTLRTKVWGALAASVAIVLLVAGAHVYRKGNMDEIDRYIKITAENSQMHRLPDSTKVWMQPGSSIRYAKDFNNDKKVWLSGNSLFEVSKQQAGHIFQVYIDGALIEVKGTCFLVEQEDAHRSEVTLFEGEIEFNAQSAQEKTVMRPLQRLVYDSANRQMQVEDIANISWGDGRYIFKEVPLSQLIRLLSHQYHVDILLEGEVGKDDLFSGSIYYNETLDDVLDKLGYSLQLEREWRDDRIVITIRK